jgi:hypothetical protein
MKRITAILLFLSIATPMDSPAQCVDLEGDSGCPNLEGVPVPAAPSVATAPVNTAGGLPAEDCPISLDSKVDLDKSDGARTQEFKERIPSILTPGMPDREKIVRVAEAAAKCGVHFGSCGNTVETIFGIVGLPTRSYNKIGISNEQMLYLDTIKCPRGSDRGCARQAKTTAYDKFKTEIPGWPGSYMQALEPGDRMTVFIAGSGPNGTHSTIFLRWKSWGTAEVLQGAWGELVKTGDICVAGCGIPSPLVRVINALPE